MARCAPGETILLASLAQHQQLLIERRDKTYGPACPGYLPAGVDILGNVNSRRTSFVAAMA